MASTRIRRAQPADAPEMVAVLFSAFQDSAVVSRCFPESYPGSHTHYISWIHKHLEDPSSHLIVAEEAEEVEERQKHPAEPPPPIAGWARWVCRSPPMDTLPEPEFKAEMYPEGGDGEFASRFFKANYDAAKRAVGSEDHWHLSMMVVRESFKRRGMGGELMRYGTSRADKEGWAAYVNGSPEAKGLYERSGFKTVEVSEFDAGIRTFHMKREARGAKTKA